MNGFTDFSEAFDFCREIDHPVNVIIGNQYKLFPSGRAELIEEAFTANEEEYPFTEDEISQEPEWVTELSQLRLEELSSLTRDEQLREIPEESVVFFL